MGEVVTRPAHLPDAVVGLPPDRLDILDHPAPTGPEAFVDPAEQLAAEERHADDLAVDVELELFGRCIADPDRLGALVAGKVTQFELREPTLPADPVHDLDLGRVARTDPQEEVAEAQRLVGIAGAEQRLEREHRVSQPAVAVVPVAYAPDVLRQ